MKLAVDRMLRAQWQYQPILTSHDPNPPMTLEDTPPPIVKPSSNEWLINARRRGSR